MTDKIPEALAVLDALELQTRQRGGSPSCATISKTRSVFAELIEAGNEWCDLMPGLAGGPEFDRLVTALAAVEKIP